MSFLLSFLHRPPVHQVGSGLAGFIYVDILYQLPVEAPCKRRLSSGERSSHFSLWDGRLFPSACIWWARTAESVPPYSKKGERGYVCAAWRWFGR